MGCERFLAVESTVESKLLASTLQKSERLPRIRFPETSQTAQASLSQHKAAYSKRGAFCESSTIWSNCMLNGQTPRSDRLCRLTIVLFTREHVNIDGKQQGEQIIAH
jgi:hypothetical protein